MADLSQIETGTASTEVTNPFAMWWARQNSNLRPLPCQGSQPLSASASSLVSGSFPVVRNKPDLRLQAAIEAVQDRAQNGEGTVKRGASSPLRPPSEFSVPLQDGRRCA